MNLRSEVEEIAAHRQADEKADPNRATHQERAIPFLLKHVAKSRNKPGCHPVSHAEPGCSSLGLHAFSFYQINPPIARVDD